MLKQGLLSMRVLAAMTAVCLSVTLFVLPAAAQSQNGSYIFLLGSGPLCDPKDPSACRVSARSSQGDRYEMTGAGWFDAPNGPVNAAGTFRHLSPDGTTLETGVWVANELLRFDAYGVAPGALPRLESAIDAEELAPKRMALPSGAMPTGGLAVFRIRLLAISGRQREAQMQVNCALGSVPAERPIDGIRLNLEESGAEFFEEAGGRVMFLAMRR